MFESNEFFLPSKHLYTLPSETEYDSAKNAYLASMDNHRYQQKSTEDKWTFVVCEMAALLQGDDIFKEGSTKPPVHYITDFKEKRKKSKSGITVAQCTGYFEDFLFLLKTSDPRFSISLRAKAALMQSITTAIDKCETGIHTTFYAILQEHQKSTDWIKSELSKTRCESIHMLQKNYSKKNTLLSDFSDVHTYNALVDLANKEGLGIKKKDDIRDWMLPYLSDPEEIGTYFAANYRATFDKYESEVEQTLTLHVISEISSTLMETSADESSVISSENSQRMDQLLSTHFSVDILPEAYLRCFFEEYGSGDCIKLVPKSQYKPVIQKWIKQTLIREGYYYSVDMLAENSTLLPNVRLRGDIAFEDFILVYRDLQQKPQLSHKAAYLTVFQAYPELVLHYIEQHIGWLSYVPQSQIKIKQQAVTIVSRLLDQAITAQHDENIRNLTEALMSFVGPDEDYVRKLSPKALNHRIVASCLIRSNGLLWCNLSQALKRDVALFDQAKAQNQWVVYLSSPQMRESKYQELVHQEPISSSKSFFSPSDELRNRETPKAQINRLMRFEARRQLATLPILSIDQFLTFIPIVSPVALVDIIHYRKAHKLAPLPFCENSSAVRYLKKFDLEVRGSDTVYWNQSALAIRKQAQDYIETAGRSAGDPRTYLVKNAHWFTSFLQYQAHHSGEGQCQVKIKRLLQALKYTAIAAVVFIASAGLGLWLLPWLSAFWLQYYMAMILVSAIFGLSCKWNNSVLIVLTGALLSVCLVLPIVTFIVAVLSLIAGMNNVLKSGYIVQLGIEKYFECMPLVGPSTESWSMRCEHVLSRLSQLDDISAQQKLAVLKKIHALMIDEPIDPSHPALIHKRYDIVYQGKNHNISFAEVAALSRTETQNFCIDPSPTAWYSLFACKTSSAKMLSDIEQQQQTPALA